MIHHYVRQSYAILSASKRSFYVSSFAEGTVNFMTFGVYPQFGITRLLAISILFCLISGGCEMFSSAAYVSLTLFAADYPLLTSHELVKF